jgi:hypothetical protein
MLPLLSDPNPDRLGTDPRRVAGRLLEVAEDRVHPLHERGQRLTAGLQVRRPGRRRPSHHVRRKHDASPVSPYAR